MAQIAVVPRLPEAMLTYDVDAQAQLQTNASQHTFSRHFRSPRLEEMYRVHAFKLGRRRIARLVFLFIVLEVYVVASSYIEGAGMRKSSIQLYVPLVIISCFLGFLLSKFNSPSRLPWLMWLMAVSYVSAILGPMLNDVINFGSQNRTDDAHEESVLLTGEREHDASWVVGCWYICAFASAVWGDSSGMGPVGCITLFWILIAMHATTMGLAYNATESDAKGKFSAFVPQLFTAGAMNAYLAWIACEASRQMFLASALASMQRMEQLAGEKERLEYERQFAETKLKQAQSSGREGSEREGSGSGERSASRAGSESASSNDELGAIHMRAARSTSSASSNGDLDAISQTAVRTGARPSTLAKPACLRKVRVCSSSAQARVRPSMLAPTSEEDRSEGQRKPVRPLARLSSIPDDEAGEPSSSREPTASPERKRTREMAELPIGCCPSESDANSSAAVSSAKLTPTTSVATSATADELRGAFAPKPAMRALAALPRSLKDYLFALRGQRPPGPMPGQMPVDDTPA